MNNLSDEKSVHEIKISNLKKNPKNQIGYSYSILYLYPVSAGSYQCQENKADKDRNGNNKI
jgi:hypothetical protein